MDQTRNLQIVISAKDEASRTIQGFRQSLSDAAADARIGAGIIVGGLTLAAKSAIDLASDYQQNRVAFEGFLGSGQKAGKLLAELSDFAVKTPFSLPQVAEGGRALLAYGVEANKIVPTFKMLGDLSQGNAVRLDRLTLAYGQVKAATRLTGAELRQFTEAGIPLLEILGKQTKRTAGQIKKAIEDSEISFDDVQKALQSATSEGGRFFNAMELQSKTFAGRMSNAKDELIRFTLAIMGMNKAGDIEKGSIFYYLQLGAERLMVTLQQIRPPVQRFIKAMLENRVAIIAFIGALVGLLVPLAMGVVGLIAPALAFAAAFAAIAVGIALVVQKVTELQAGFRESFPAISGYLDEITGQVGAFKERLLDSFNVDSNSGLVGFFNALKEQAVPAMEEVRKQLSQGFTNSLKLNFGEAGNFGDLMGRLAPIITTISDLFFRVLTPSIEALKEAFAEAKPFIDQFLQQMGPILINGLQVLAGVIAGIIIVLLALFTGLMRGIAEMIPFIAQFMAGLAQVIGGFMTLIVGIFTFNGEMVKQGLTDLVQGILNIFIGGFGSLIAFIGGFVTGVIKFFQTLYDTLIGHSIIPDLVEGILKWMGKLKTGALDTIGSMASGIRGVFSGLASSAFGWGSDIINNMINGIKSAVRGAGKLASTLLGKLGVSASDLGLSFQHGGFVPGAYNQAVPAILHGGERVVPRNGTDVNPGGGGGGPALTLNFTGPVSMDSTERVNELAQRVIDILGRQNELAAKGVSF